MNEEQLPDNYVPEFDGADMKSPDATISIEVDVQVYQSATLSDEALEQIVARAGPAPEIDKYIRRPTPALLVVLTGPSGVGKDVTLERMKELGAPFHYVVTV